MAMTVIQSWGVIVLLMVMSVSLAYIASKALFIKGAKGDKGDTGDTGVPGRTGASWQFNHPLIGRYCTELPSGAVVRILAVDPEGDRIRFEKTTGQVDESTLDQFTLTHVPIDEPAPRHAANEPVLMGETRTNKTKSRIITVVEIYQGVEDSERRITGHDAMKNQTIQAVESDFIRRFPILIRQKNSQ